MKLTVPYAQAALPSLQMYEGMSEQEAIEFIERSDFDTIESRAWASSSVIPAAKAIGEAFGLTPEEIEEFTQEMLGKTDSTRVTDMIREAVSRIDPGDLAHVATKLTVDTMEHVHDNWVDGNTKHFFGKKADQEKQFQYLPLALIGWKEAKLDLQYIRPVMEAIGFQVDDAEIKRECNARTMETLSRCNPEHPDFAGHEEMSSMTQVTSEDLLQEMILSGCEGYSEHWTPDMQKAMSDPAFIEGYIMPQLESKGFGSDYELMDQVHEAGLDIFQDDRGPQVLERD